jgi:sugar phosphate isomerase/epimerase
VLRALDELAPKAQSLGLKIALENGLPGYMVTTSELLSLVSEYGSPAVGICYDSGHAHITDDTACALKTLGPHVVTVHLHDNDGKEDQHLLPGEGTLDWKAVVAALGLCPRLAHVETEAANCAAWKWSKEVRPHREVYGLYCQILNAPGSGLSCR